MERVSAWKAEPVVPGDKEITLVGPDDGFYPQRIFVDFDDVNHDVIEKRVPLIVEALNELAETDRWRAAGGVESDG